MLSIYKNQENKNIIICQIFFTKESENTSDGPPHIYNFPLLHQWWPTEINDFLWSVVAAFIPWPLINLISFFVGLLNLFYSRFYFLFLWFAAFLLISCFTLLLDLCSLWHLCDVTTKNILLDLIFRFLTGVCSQSRISFYQLE